MHTCTKSQLPLSKDRSKWHPAPVTQKSIFYTLSLSLRLARIAIVAESKSCTTIGRSTVSIKQAKEGQQSKDVQNGSHTYKGSNSSSPRQRDRAQQQCVRPYLSGHWKQRTRWRMSKCAWLELVWYDLIGPSSTHHRIPGMVCQKALQEGENKKKWSNKDKRNQQKSIRRCRKKNPQTNGYAADKIRTNVQQPRNPNAANPAGTNKKPRGAVAEEKYAMICQYRQQWIKQMHILKQE